MKKKYTITIGIPAYNEKENILLLLKDLENQKLQGLSIQKIIVSSDHSTDGTNELVKNYKNSKIVLLNSKKREGQAARQNDIFRNSSSDILVLLNADIRITDKNFLKKITTPIIENHADLTSSYPVALPAEGFIEKILKKSIEIKTNIFESYNNGDNIYTCHGRARAFSKKLYKKLKFEKSVGEDAYSYLFCKKNGYTYENVASAKVLYKLPENISDHKKQSIRFIQTKQLLSDAFGSEFVESEYSLPKLLTIKSFIKSFIHNPFSVISYVGIFIFLKTRSNSEEMTKNTWSSSKSSKKLILKGGQV